MIIILNYLTFFVCVWLFIKSLKKRRSFTFMAMLIFDAAYVLPIVIESIFGTAEINYKGFYLANSDSLTGILYNVFLLFSQFLFYKNIKGYSKKKRNIRVTFKKFVYKLKKNKWLKILSVIFILSPMVVVLFAPSPSLYFKHLGAFAMNTTFYTPEDLAFHNQIMQNMRLIASLGIIMLKLCAKKTIITDFLIILGTVEVTIIDGKRTMLTFLLLVILLIDYFLEDNKNKFYKEVLLFGTIIITYFVLYSYITGKYEYNRNWYAVISEYFFRSNSVKIAIYGSLYPENLKILDYPFQTLLFDILFFIPRAIWPSKPFPYPDYYTSAIFGFDKLTSIGWNFQTDIYSECIANLGLVGIFLGPIFIIFMCRIVDRASSLLVIIFGIMFISLIQIFEFSDLLKIIFIFWCLAIIKGKLFKKRIKLIF